MSYNSACEIASAIVLAGLICGFLIGLAIVLAAKVRR